MTANNSLVYASASPPTEPAVSIAATFTFSNGTPITINSGNVADLKKGIVNFSLTEPVVLGSLKDFVGWITSRFGLPDINADIEDLKTQIGTNPILKSLYNGFMSFYEGIITITVLVVNRTETSYKFQLGVTLDLNPPIDFFDFITFDSIGVFVNMSGTSTNA